VKASPFTPDSTAAAAPGRAAAPAAGLARLTRLTRKELRETLRDRRTIVTLVFMPLLLYPLLSVAFKQLLGADRLRTGDVEYRVAFATREDGDHVGRLLSLSGAVEPRPLGSGAAERPAGPRFTPEYAADPATFDPERAVREHGFDVGVRVYREPTGGAEVRTRIDLVYVEGSLYGSQAAALLEHRLTQADAAILARRLAGRASGPVRLPIEPRRVPLAAEAGLSVSLVTLVPLVLILMTITGAVYPAIDLTAGERERGTLEVLVAAPVPRLALLWAKYLAVLAVALLTAVVNLGTMTLTVLASGLGPTLLGPRGLTWLLVVEVLGLLALLATFYSAVLLALCSCARSFKEAQAYLIPLMMVSIAPGLLSLAPGLTLNGAWSVVPLANMVLLGRDLLEHRATLGAALVVVVSTLLYATAAVAVAARLFASESVLYSSESGWADLVRRPRSRVDRPSLAAALGTLAVIFPAFFYALHAVARLPEQGLWLRLAGAATATIFVFAILPLAVAAWNRVACRTAFALGPPLAGRGARRSTSAVVAAGALGLSLWPLAHELTLLQFDLGLAELSPQTVELVEKTAEALRRLPAVYVVLVLGVVPGVCEELCFRGFLFSALRPEVRPWRAILVSALLFGAFHLVTPAGIEIVRFLPSTLLGMVLGWARWRTGSVWPAVLLHVAHNGLLMLLVFYEPRLPAAGVAAGSQAHLPPAWLTAAALVAVAGAVLLALASSRKLQPDAAH
jgi:sodium transport system permease protein